MSAILNLNQALQTLFQTSTSDNMVSLRDQVNNLWDTEAPMGTPYPILTFENIDTTVTGSFCTDVELAPIDFKVYAPLKQTTLELGYLVRKAFLESPTLSGNYTLLSNLYDSTYTQFDAVNGSFVTVVSFDYSVQSPTTPWNISPYDPTILQNVSTTVQNLSTHWEAGRGYPINFGFEDPYNNYPIDGDDVMESMLINQDLSLSEGVAKCDTPCSSVITIFDIYKNSTKIGDITFNIGDIDGIVNITPTNFVAGDYVKILKPSTIDEDLYNIQINLLGFV